jgi:hypothetical protein
MSRTWIKNQLINDWDRSWQIPSAVRLEHEDCYVYANITWEDAPDGLRLTVASLYETHRNSGIFAPVDIWDMAGFESTLASLKKVGEKLARELRDSMNGGVMAEKSIDRVTTEDIAPSSWARRQAYRHGWDGVGSFTDCP